MELKEFVYKEKKQDDFLDTSAFAWCKGKEEETSDMQAIEKDVIEGIIMLALFAGLLFVACIVASHLGIELK